MIPAVNVSDAGGTFTGNPFRATATVTGVSGVANGSLENVTPTLLYYVGSTASGTGSAAAPTTVGTYTVVATFPASTDYSSGASSSASFSITQATPTVHVSDVGGIFTGNPLPATATVTGVSGGANANLDGVSPTLLYYLGSTVGGTGSATAPTTAGIYTVVATFPDSTDYTNASNSTTFSITQATPMVIVSDTGGIQTGNPFAAAATVTGVSSVANASLEGVTPTLLYYVGSNAGGTGSATAPTTAGTYTVVATFPGSTDYTTASSSATFSIFVYRPTVSAKRRGRGLHRLAV